MVQGGPRASGARLAGFDSRVSDHATRRARFPGAPTLRLSCRRGGTADARALRTRRSPVVVQVQLLPAAPFLIFDFILENTSLWWNRHTRQAENLRPSGHPGSIPGSDTDVSEPPARLVERQTQSAQTRPPSGMRVRIARRAPHGDIMSHKTLLLTPYYLPIKVLRWEDAVKMRYEGTAGRGRRVRGGDLLALGHLEGARGPAAPQPFAQ
jgi:hypothetical protein